MPALFGFSAGFRPALHYVELNLTSLSIAFYDFPRRDGPILVVERAFGKHSRNRNVHEFAGRRRREEPGEYEETKHAQTCITTKTSTVSKTVAILRKTAESSRMLELGEMLA